MKIRDLIIQKNISLAADVYFGSCVITPKGKGFEVDFYDDDQNHMENPWEGVDPEYLLEQFSVDIKAMNNLVDFLEIDIITPEDKEPAPKKK